MSKTNPQTKERGLAHTAHARFLLAYIPAMIGVIVLFVTLFEFITFTDARDELDRKLHRMGGNLSVVLAEPVAQNQVEIVDSVIANAISDRDVATIRVYGMDGMLMSEIARSTGTNEPVLQFLKPLVLATGQTTVTVGRLELSLSDLRLYEAMLNRLYFAATLSAMLLIAVIVIGSFVYRRIIGAPLDQLVAVIEETEHGKSFSRLDASRGDEIGDVFKAFNKMRDRQHRNEIELEAARAGLERRVRERTAELKEAHDNALAASRAKSQFLANMSHEFRTPLNSIIGFAEILGSDSVADAGLRQEYAVDIRESGVHLLTLINDLLDLSKAEAGKLELQESVLDISATIDVCCGMIRTIADQKQIDLSVNVPPSAPALRGDERKIRQMILNLVSNAAKFTPKGGKITVTGHPAADGGFSITIADTGVGIAEDDQQRVLQPFVQVDSSFSRKHTGTGLGLPLVRTLCELHGGELSLKSILGEGTSVSIHFPSERVQYDVRAVGNAG